MTGRAHNGGGHAATRNCPFRALRLICDVQQIPWRVMTVRIYILYLLLSAHGMTGVPPSLPLRKSAESAGARSVLCVTPRLQGRTRLRSSPRSRSCTMRWSTRGRSVPKRWKKPALPSRRLLHCVAYLHA
jgi:hypothetical protein